ncbi:MAG: hypothetical protein CSA84_03655, partial [Actinomycetales bacterium]
MVDLGSDQNGGRRLSRLVVFIPGIGGSVLADPETGDVVWSHRRRHLARALIDPQSLDPDRPLCATGLLDDVQLLPGWTVMPGYGMAWEQLCGIPGAIPGENLVAFPYDFRQSNRDSAARLDAVVRDRLAALGRTDEPDSVIVVAHSMGGLVARHWISQLGGHEVCHALLTLGTPHRGAPKALDTLANGLAVPGTRRILRLKELGQALRTWPSMAELLPRYPCIQHPDAPDEGMRVHELTQVDTSWAWLAELGQAGWAFHSQIEAGWADLHDRPMLRARAGVLQPTLRSATLNGNRLAV